MSKSRSSRHDTMRRLAVYLIGVAIGLVLLGLLHSLGKPGSGPAPQSTSGSPENSHDAEEPDNQRAAGSGGAGVRGSGRDAGGSRADPR